MNYKALVAFLTVLASVAGIGSFVLDIFPRQEQSPTGKSKLDIPDFDFSLEPFPGWRGDPKLGEKFNNTMGTYLNKTVYLSITLSEGMTQDVRGERDEYGRLIFTVPDDADNHSNGGSEYLIHLSEKDPSPFEFRDNLAVLSGYFKVYDINGPRQGFMSVNLRPAQVD